MSCSIVLVPVLLLLSNTVILGTSAESIPLENCGQRAVLSQHFVSNGFQSWLGEWPWHVAIFNRMNQSSPSYSCGGTIITSSYILTLALCTYSSTSEQRLNPSELLILAGISNLQLKEQSLQQISVEEITVHKKNDIALLKVSGSLEFTDYVKPICLWRDIADEKLIVDKLGYVTGWGIIDRREFIQLHHAEMLIVSRVQCLNSDRRTYSTILVEHIFCAGFQHGTAVGMGDSGGGLYIKNDDIWILRGIVKSGKPNQAGQVDTSSYIMFVDVAHFLPWIKNKTIETIRNSTANASLENLLSKRHLVDLRHKNLTTLTNEQLSNNSWTCDCTSEDFIHFVLENHPNMIICEDGRKVNSLTLNDLCKNNASPIITICLFLACSGFFIGILSAFYYYYQVEIKVWLFTHNLFLWFVTEEELDKDKLYDAFISYSHQDAQFVECELIPRMENQMKLKTCLHERDWIPGETILEQIITSVANSRRTVIVLSKHFLESTWAQMEFRTAHLQSLAEKRIRVVIIVFGDIGDVESVDAELKAYLKMNTYVRYEDPWFWDKLRYAMPHTVTATELRSRHAREDLDGRARVREQVELYPCTSRAGENI